MTKQRTLIVNCFTCERFFGDSKVNPCLSCYNNKIDELTNWKPEEIEVLLARCTANHKIYED